MVEDIVAALNALPGWTKEMGIVILTATRWVLLAAVASGLLGGQCLSLADYVTVTAPTGEAVAAGCC